MRENRKFHFTAAELFQSWTRQPWESQDSLAGSLGSGWEDIFGCHTQGKQFAYVYDYKQAGMVFVSDSIRHVLGYEPENVSLEFFYAKLHPADQEEVLKITRAGGEMMLQHKEIDALSLFLTVDCRLQHAQGHYIKMQRQTSILRRDKAGNIRSSLGIFTDISHLHRSKKVSFDLSMPEYKARMLDILASYDPGFAQGEFSMRERQVLRLMALGKNTRQIAQQLSLSNFTVDTHRKNMKKKLRARNTAELITAAFTRKLI